MLPVGRGKRGRAIQGKGKKKRVITGLYEITHVKLSENCRVLQNLKKLSFNKKNHMINK